MTVAQDGVDGGEAARQLGDAHRQLLTDNSIQFELPTGGYGPGDRQVPMPNSPPAAPTADPSLAPPQAAPTIQGDPAAAPPAPASAPDLSASGGSSGLDGVMQVFLWIAAGIALAILLYWLFAFFCDRGLGGREGRPRKLREAKGEGEAWRPEESLATELLDEADVLASQGRYDEAARLLLHRSIGEIHAHRPDLVRPALTSRDIAGHPLLPSGPAAAFARIAALVERSFFARRALGPDDWQDCRTAYREFAFAEGWQG
ncbi:MAG TPA: hypothetical protein VEC11_10600 [Allosphingosinicella sp.]|nr:hypothetical protein [Allosphingosinicella sp.]